MNGPWRPSVLSDSSCRQRHAQEGNEGHAHVQSQVAMSEPLASPELEIIQASIVDEGLTDAVRTRFRIVAHHTFELLLTVAGKSINDHPQ